MAVIADKAKVARGVLDARDALGSDTVAMFLPQVFALCGLPIGLEERRVTRTIQLGPGHTVDITFSSASKSGVLPGGSDRHLLAYIMTLAIRRGIGDSQSAAGFQVSHEPDSVLAPPGSTWVGMKTMTEFFRTFGIEARGGRSYLQLGERIERLTGFSVMLEHSQVLENGTIDKQSHNLGSPIPRSFYSLPSRRGGTSRQLTLVSGDGSPSPHQMRIEQIDAPYGFEISASFMEYFRRHPVPVPLPLLLLFKSSPQAWDVCALLCHRCWLANRPSQIPWSSFRAQLASGDQDSRRLLSVVRKVIKTIRAAGYGSFPVGVIAGSRSREPRILVDHWQPPIPGWPRRRKTPGLLTFKGGEEKRKR